MSNDAPDDIGFDLELLPRPVQTAVLGLMEALVQAWPRPVAPPLLPARRATPACPHGTRPRPVRTARDPGLSARHAHAALLCGLYRHRCGRSGSGRCAGGPPPAVPQNAAGDPYPRNPTAFLSLARDRAPAGGPPGVAQCPGPDLCL